MKCWRGTCKYQNEKICTVDSKPCDYTRKLVDPWGDEEHCHQENNKELREINPDTALMTGISEEHILLPFFSCQNLCKYYTVCDEK